MNISGFGSVWNQGISLNVPKVVELDDQNVIQEFAKALKSSSEERMRECLAYMTDYTFEDLHGSLDRYLHFRNKLTRYGEIYQSKLDEAIYPFLDVCPELHTLLQDYFRGEKGEDRSYDSLCLIDLAFKKKDTGLALILIDHRNRWLQACGKKSLPHILNMLGALTQESFSMRTLVRALELSEDHAKLSDQIRAQQLSPNETVLLLNVAYLVKSTKLFTRCLEGLSPRNPMGGMVEEVPIYAEMYRSQPLDHLRHWAGGLLVNAFLSESCQSISERNTELLSLLAFLRNYAEEADPDAVFMKELDVATKNFSAEERGDFALFLFAGSLNFQYIPLVQCLIKIIPHWHLHQNLEFRKELMKHFVKVLDHFLIANAWLEGLQSLPRDQEGNPLIVYLKEYLEDLPQQHAREVFRLLTFGLAYNALPIINLCLVYIDSKNIHHLSPLLDRYVRFIHLGERERVFHGEVRIRLAQEVICTVPEAVLKMRAPHLLSVLETETGVTKEDALNLIYWIHNPQEATKASMQTALLASKAGAHQIVRMVEEKYDHLPLQWEDTPLVLKLFAAAFGASREKLFVRLFACAMERFPTDPLHVQLLIAQIRDIDPDLLKNFAVYPVLSLLTASQQMVTPTAWQIELIHDLIPEIEALDLKQCRLSSGFLDVLFDYFPRLQRLIIDERLCDKKGQAGLSHFHQLSHLEIYNPRFQSLQPHSCAHLRSLVLHDLPHINYLEGIQWGDSLQSLIVTNLNDYYSEAIGDERLALLFSSGSNLKVIGLDSGKHLSGSQMTEKSIEMLHRQTKDLQSISCSFRFIQKKHLKTCEALIQWIAANPTLSEFAFTEKIDDDFPKKEALLSAVIQLPALKKLRLHLGVNDATAKQIVMKHPDLEELDLSHSLLTAESLPELAKLKQLQRLTLVNTPLTFIEVSTLVAELPQLKHLTIGFTKTDYDITQDHLRLKDALAPRKIEVVFSDSD